MFRDWIRTAVADTWQRTLPGQHVIDRHVLVHHNMAIDHMLLAQRPHLHTTLRCTYPLSEHPFRRLEAMPRTQVLRVPEMETATTYMYVQDRYHKTPCMNDWNKTHGKAKNNYRGGSLQFCTSQMLTFVTDGYFDILFQYMHVRIPHIITSKNSILRASARGVRMRDGRRVSPAKSFNDRGSENGLIFQVRFTARTPRMLR